MVSLCAVFQSVRKNKDMMDRKEGESLTVAARDPENDHNIQMVTQKG